MKFYKSMTYFEFSNVNGKKTLQIPIELKILKKKRRGCFPLNLFQSRNSLFNSLLFFSNNLRFDSRLSRTLSKIWILIKLRNLPTTRTKTNTFLAVSLTFVSRKLVKTKQYGTKQQTQPFLSEQGERDEENRGRSCGMIIRHACITCSLDRPASLPFLAFAFKIEFLLCPNQHFQSGNTREISPPMDK